MKNIIFLILCFSLFLSCNSSMYIEDSHNISIQVDTVLNEEISIRALLVDGDRIWYAGDKSRVGFYDSKTGLKKQIQIYNDSLKHEFRSIAQNESFIFVANIGSPAYFYKIDKSYLTFTNVYTDYNEKTFYDSMNFWNDKEGIAVGDPTEDCLSLVITRNGGESWSKISCDFLPKTFQGEAAFAASNTNISIFKDKCWIVSGGKKSRVFFSSDKGKVWQVFETPIIQGKGMTGIFSSDFYNDKIGFVVGGDYENQLQNFKNKAITLDGGKNWSLVSDYEGFGYASCIQFVSFKKPKYLVSVGVSGIQYSKDFGKTWRKALEDNDLYTIKTFDERTFFSAGKNKIIKIKLLNP